MLLRKPELKDMCSPVFITALFTIAWTWKQPRCPSADKWIRNLWYIHTMEYYSVIKKKAFESVLMRWMKLEPIIQSEVSQKEKHQYSISSVQFSRSVVSNSLRPHESQHARPPCPSPTPGVHSDSCPSADKWIRKLWYIYTIEYYSAIKKMYLNQF